MHIMRKYFSPYLEKLEKQDKNTRIALIVAAFGMLLFLSLALTLPFRDTLFAGLFPKDPSKAQEVNDLIAQRKMELIATIKDPGPNGSCLNKAAYILASLYKNVQVDIANNYISTYHSSPTCKPTPDTSTGFSGYWSLVHMWRVYLDPTTNSHLSSDSNDKILEMMWLWTNTRSNFTYANESAFTIRSSENHQAMQNSANFLALQALKDAPGYGPNKTLADGRTIEAHYNAWLGYWMRYFQGRAREGINVEIASPIYAKYTVASYFNIYDFTKSQALKNEAKNFLDLYFADVAQEFLPNGIRGGAETRSYQNAYSFNGPHFSFYGLLCVYDWYPCTVRGGIWALISAISPYNPPEIVRAIARDVNKPPYAYVSRRMGQVDNLDSSQLKIENGSFIKRYSYVTPEYILGTLQVDSAKYYTALNYQNRLMGVFFADDPTSRIIVIGKGTHRPTKDVGWKETNGIAGPNAAVIGRDPTAERSIGTRIFIRNGKLRDNLSPTVESGWLFTRNDSAFAAIRIADGGYTTEEATYLSDPTTPVSANGIFLNLTNMWSPIIIQLGRAVDYPSFDDFKAKVKQTSFTYENGKLTYTSLNGDKFEYWAQSTNVAKINGDSNLNPQDTYNSRYIKQVHGQGITTVSYGGQTLTINTDCVPVGGDDCSAMNPTTPTKTPTPTVSGKFCKAHTECSLTEACVSNRCTPVSCPVAPPDSCTFWSVSQHACAEGTRAPGTPCKNSQGQTGVCDNSGAGICLVNITPSPKPSGTGLTGVYFDKVNFTNQRVTRTDPQINFNWKKSKPVNTVNADSFSIRWTGFVQPQYSQSYIFSTNSNDGARLWVNKQLIIDNWVKKEGYTEKSGTTKLTAGQKYAITLEYFDNTGNAGITLSWESPSQPKQIIPQVRLYPN